jgi:hypothetical protein
VWSDEGGAKAPLLIAHPPERLAEERGKCLGAGS